MLTITVQRARGAGEPSGRSSTARRWFSNWLVTAPSWVQWPVLCGRIASSLTSTRPSRGLEQLDREHAGDVRARRRRCSAICCACAGQVRVEVGRRGDHLVADRRRAGSTRRPGTPRPGRSATAPTSAASSRRKSTSSSASSPTPVAAAAANASSQSSAEPTNHTPLPSYPPRVVLSTHGKPERRDVGSAASATSACRGQGTPSAVEPLPHHAPCPGRAPAPRARAGRRRRRPRARAGARSGTCSWSKVTTAQPSVTVAQRRRGRGSRRPAWSGIDLGRRDVRRLGEQPQRQPERDRRLRPSSGPAGRRR